MPEIYIYAIEGRTTDQKRRLAREITDAVTRNFEVPSEVVVIQFVEAARESKARGGVLFSERAPPAAVAPI
jgi:4-oxalocrotonate tautomerase